MFFARYYHWPQQQQVLPPAGIFLALCQILYHFKAALHTTLLVVYMCIS